MPFGIGKREIGADVHKVWIFATEKISNEVAERAGTVPENLLSRRIFGEAGFPLSVGLLKIL